MAKLYGSIKHLVSVDSYSLTDWTPNDPATTSVNLSALRSFLDSNPAYLETINSGLTITRIATSVTLFGGSYRLRVYLQYSGGSVDAYSAVNADHNAVITAALNDTGISFNTTPPTTTQITFITLSGETFEYKSEQIDKLYGPISDGQGGYVSKKILKLYGSVNGQTKLIYEDANA